MNALPNWLTPEGAWKGIEAQRLRNLQNWRGSQYRQELFTYVFNFPSIAFGASAMAQVFIEKDVTFEWMQTSMLAQGPSTTALNRPAISIQIIDGGMSKNVFSDLAPVANICSAQPTVAVFPVTPLNAVLPHELPIPKTFLPKSTITCVASNFDTALSVTNLQVTLTGKKTYNLPPPLQQRSWKGFNGKYYTEDYYGYVMNIGTLALGASMVENQLLVEGDSDFEWQYLTLTTSPRGQTTGQLVNSGALSFLMQDGASQRNLFSQNAIQLAGFGGFPMILPVTKIFEANSQINIFSNNLDTGAALNNVSFVLEGRKIYEVPN